MAIKPLCDDCGQELVDFGAILLSPPKADSTVMKYHLCVVCYERIKNELMSNKQNENSAI